MSAAADNEEAAAARPHEPRGRSRWLLDHAASPDAGGTTGGTVHPEPAPRVRTFALLPDEVPLQSPPPPGPDETPAFAAAAGAASLPPDEAGVEWETVRFLVLPDTCCWCIPLKAGVQVFTSFDMIIAIYNVGREVQDLQWYDSPSTVAQVVNAGGGSGFTVQKGSRAVFVAQLAWSVILLANACVGFVGIGKNLLAPVRTYTVMFAISGAVELFQALRTAIYRERWHEPLTGLDISVNFIWVLLRFFVFYQLYFWYRMLTAHYEQEGYESRTGFTRMMRRVSQAIGLGRLIDPAASGEAGAEREAARAAGRRTRFRRMTRLRRSRAPTEAARPDAASSGIEMVER